MGSEWRPLGIWTNIHDNGWVTKAVENPDGTFVAWAAPDPTARTAVVPVCRAAGETRSGFRGFVRRSKETIPFLLPSCLILVRRRRAVKLPQLRGRSAPHSRTRTKQIAPFLPFSC